MPIIVTSILSLIMVVMRSPLFWCIALPVAAALLFGKAAHHGYFE